MQLLSTYEQAMRLYRLACFALFTIPVLTLPILSPIPPSITPAAQLEYLTWVSALAATAGLLAIRMRELARSQGLHGTQLLAAFRTNAAKVGEYRLPLTEMVDALHGNERSKERLPIDPSVQKEHRKARRFASNIKSSDNSQLARRLEADQLRRPEKEIPRVETSVATPRLGVHKEEVAIRHALTSEEVQELFRALLKGTTKYLNREPNVSEFERLIDACGRMIRPNPLMTAAHDDRLVIHWAGTGWLFDFEAPEV